MNEKKNHIQHPWESFLDARYRAIMWLHGEGKSDKQISFDLSMDGEEQVYLIRTSEINKILLTENKNE